MKYLFDTLELIQKDVVFPQLHPDTKARISAAKVRLEQITPHISNWQLAASQYTKMALMAQKYKFVGFKSMQGRFLAKEADCYPSCANT